MFQPERRIGKVTASRICDVLASIKSGEAAARRDYRMQLALERATGRSHESDYTNGHMQRGNDLEPDALAAYEIRTGAIVDDSGFVDHPTIPRAGCSPDGLIDSDGMVQAKCPKPAIHYRYSLENRIPPEYVSQIAFELACTVREWSDFVSYCPTMPKPLHLVVVRVYVHELRKEIDEIELAVRKFSAEVDEETERLRRRLADASREIAIE